MKKLVHSLLTILSVGFIISSCNFSDLPDTDITISQDFMSHVAVVNFISDTSEGASGLLDETLDNTVVTISGADASKVYNIEGKKSFIITGGKVQLFLDPTADFSGDKVYKVDLIVEPAGYLKRIVPVTFTKDQNDSSYEVAMLKKSSMPAGITSATNTSGAVTVAGLTTPINLTASNATTNGVTTAITVPAGIKMKDANNTVLTGKLETEVISFSETGYNTAYFPGGLSPQNIDMGDGTTASGAFVSAGFASIDMTVGGKKVKTFEGAKVAVKMTLSKENYNPKTDAPFVAGDAIDVWSYDNDKGQWKFESTGIVKKDGDSSLYVSFETSHLSYFNLDYLFKGNEGYCTNYYNTIQFNWASSTTAVNARVVFKSLASGANTSGWEQLFVTKYETINKGDVFPIYNGPRAATKLEVYDTSSGKLLLSKNFAKGALCANPSVTLNVPNPPSPVKVTLKYKGTCSNTTATVLPPVGTSLSFREKGTTAWRSFHTVTYKNRNQTSITTSLVVVGKTYEFKAFVGSKSDVRTYTISQANMSFEVKIPDDICKSLVK